MSFDWRRAAGLNIVGGSGQIPTQRFFDRLRAPLWIGCGGVHANPRYFKVYGRIFSRSDIIPNEKLSEFKERFGPRPWLAIVPELTFHAAIARMRELSGRGERFMVILEHVKRDDPDAPWDIPLLRAQGRRLAPAYDADPDEPFFGHK